MQLYIGLHHSRHGVDVYPLFYPSNADNKSVRASLWGDLMAKIGDNWEGEGTEANREDEYVEVSGPFEIPTEVPPSLGQDG